MLGTLPGALQSSLSYLEAPVDGQSHLWLPEMRLETAQLQEPAHCFSILSRRGH
jgi:hypothetical protein